jgi:uncharacterized membrane protein YkvA (DUF1232 family)
MGKGETAPVPGPQAPAPAGGALPVPVASPKVEAARLKAFWPKFWRAMGRVPFSEDLVAAWYCWADPKTPAHAKAVLAGALAYFVMPADMVPDVLAGLGFTDDAAVLATAIGLAGAHIKRRHKHAARKLLRRTEKDQAESDQTGAGRA